MKAIIKTIGVFFITLIIHETFAQITTIYDFEGENFDHSPVTIITLQDSLYILTRSGGDFNKGALFSIDYNGNGYNLIYSFDASAYPPYSMITNNTEIYGTTKLSENGGGKMFRYILGTGRFDFLKEFTHEECINGVSLKFIDNYTILGFSWDSFEDSGNIFTILKDGSGFTKIFNNTNSENGMTPADICMVNNELFVAFYNGGGIPYENDGDLYSSGCVVKMDIDGVNYQKIIECQDLIGTHPRSLIHYNGKIYGLFSSAGNDRNAKLFSINTNGSDFSVIADIEHTGRGNITGINNFIFGITSESIFGYDLIAHTDTIIQEFNSLIGRDATAGPFFHENAFYVGTQQGGEGSGGGSILKIETDLIHSKSELLNIRNCTVSPNPASDYISIHLNNLHGKNLKKLILYDSDGRIRINKNFNGNDLKLELNSYKLLPGIYFYDVIVSNIKKYSGKLIIISNQ